MITHFPGLKVYYASLEDGKHKFKEEIVLCADMSRAIELLREKHRDSGWTLESIRHDAGADYIIDGGSK